MTEEVAVMVSYLPFIRHLKFMNSISMFLLVLFDVPTWWLSDIDVCGNGCLEGSLEEGQLWDPSRWNRYCVPSCGYATMCLMLIWSEDPLWEHSSINYLIPTVRLMIYKRKYHILGLFFMALWFINLMLFLFSGILIRFALLSPFTLGKVF